MTENSKVLALKYRPQVFEDLIGQEIIAETIKNSIISDKSPNAFLFTGIRGVGKTTFARIVAKSLNCEHGIENMCKKNVVTVMQLQTQIILMFWKWMQQAKQVLTM
jgi:DNA polymerase-3 subunit gamma/tau